MTRTGSIGSRVPPAVTRTRSPARSRGPERPLDGGHDRARARPGGRRRRRRRPGGPASGSTTCTPRRRSVARLSCTAGCSHISVCIAGQTTTGARVASRVAVSRSSRCRRRRRRAAGPWPAPRATRSAVWPRRVCGMGSASSHSEVCTGSEARADERGAADEALGPLGHDGHDVGAGVDQPAADLDGLVGRDPAGDAEHDAPPGEWRHGLLADLASSLAGSRPARRRPRRDAARRRPPRASSPGSTWTNSILSAAISSKAIDSGLRATEVTCGGTMAPRPSPRWLK